MHACICSLSNFVFKKLYAARRLYSKLIHKLNQIRIFPEIYPVYATNNTNFIWRKMFVENYAAFYAVNNNTIKVARMIYNRRNSEGLHLEEVREEYIV